jgi:hypothetical protein
MSLTATVQANVAATRTEQSGLTRASTEHPVSFSFNVGDCSKVWSDRRTFGAIGHDDIDLLASGIAIVKLVCIKNLSNTSAIAMTAGWSGTDFRNFVQDFAGWNFSPMINLGSLTLRGYPIREGGAFLLSCPNSSGFATTSGGSILRIGGVQGEQYEIYVMGN